MPKFSREMRLSPLRGRFCRLFHGSAAHPVQDAICHIANSFLENVAQVAAGAVICRGKEVDPVLVILKVVAGAEALAGGVVGVVHRNTGAALLAHDSEAGDIRGPIAQVYHVAEGNGAEVGIHVVVDVLRIVNHPFVDAEEKLCLGGVRDDTLGEADAAVALAELAGKHLPEVGADNRTVDESLNAAGDDVELHMNAGKTLLRCEGACLKGLKELRQPPVEGELLAELAQGFIAHAIDAQRIQQLFQVAEFPIPPLFAAALVALFPEELGIDAELREDGILLHIVRGERLIKIKDECNGVLRHSHGGRGVR